MPRSYGEVMGAASASIRGRALWLRSRAAYWDGCTHAFARPANRGIPDERLRNASIASRSIDNGWFGSASSLRQGKDDSGVVTGRLEPPRPWDVSALPEAGQRRVRVGSRRSGAPSSRTGGVALVVLAGRHGDAHGRRRQGARRGAARARPFSISGSPRSTPLETTRRRGAAALAHDERGDRRPDPRGARVTPRRRPGRGVPARALAAAHAQRRPLPRRRGARRASTHRATATCPTRSKKSGLLERFVARGGRTLLSHEPRQPRRHASIRSSSAFTSSTASPSPPRWSTSSATIAAAFRCAWTASSACSRSSGIPKTFDPAQRARLQHERVSHRRARAARARHGLALLHGEEEGRRTSRSCSSSASSNEVTGELDTVYLRAAAHRRPNARFLAGQGFRRARAAPPGNRSGRARERIARDDASRFVATRVARRRSCCSCGGRVAAAQTPVGSSDARCPSVGRSIVSVEDSSALVVNPGEPRARCRAVSCAGKACSSTNEALVPWQGTRVLVRRLRSRSINWASGLRLDLVDPPADAPRRALRRALELPVAHRRPGVRGRRRRRTRRFVPARLLRERADRRTRARGRSAYTTRP